MELTILMPCLNEAETLATCIKKAQSFMERAGIDGEVVIADNGSTDGSQGIATELGARVVPIDTRGYGSALRGGIQAARGKYVIMADSDDSYDFGKLEPFVEKLRAGWQLVMGNRFRGGIVPGAMPKLHRYLGNPVLTAVGRIFFRSPCGDFHCGLRGFDKQAILGLDLQAPGMEFASEMVVKATINKLRITEVPTILSPDGRSRPPHLRSWRDGWRHLRFLLLFSPRTRSTGGAWSSPVAAPENAVAPSRRTSAMSRPSMSETSRMRSRSASLPVCTSLPSRRMVTASQIS